MGGQEENPLKIKGLLVRETGLEPVIMTRKTLSEQFILLFFKRHAKPNKIKSLFRRNHF